MPDAFNILDKRITERLAKSYGATLQTITTSQAETLSSLVARATVQMKRFSPVRTLRIFAHGLYASLAAPAGTTIATTGGVSGGFGIQLAREGLHLTTVGQLRPFRALLDPDARVLVYACGAAVDAYPADPNNVLGNGRMLMAQLAATLGVPVFASEATQRFMNKTYTPQFFGSATTFSDFGAWEGAVFRFEPSGAVTRATATVPLR